MSNDTEHSEPLHVRGMTALQEGRYKEGVALLEEGIKAGDGNCQCFLAIYYLEGDGEIKQNHSEARRLLELSVAQHNRYAEYVYGKALYYGDVFPREKKRGIRLVKRAALMGLPDAQTFVSQHYGTKFWHAEKTVAWALIAAENGDEEAKEYFNGRELPPGYAQALAAKIKTSIEEIRYLAERDQNEGLKKIEHMIDVY